MWPELQKARDNARNIEKEIEKLLTNQNSFGKKEIVRQADTLLAEIDSAFESIEKETAEMKENLGNHRKYVLTKSRFLKRHYSRKKRLNILLSI